MPVLTRYITLCSFWFHTTDTSTNILALHVAVTQSPIFLVKHVLFIFLDLFAALTTTTLHDCTECSTFHSHSRCIFIRLSL